MFNIRNNQEFSLHYKRVVPKCSVCGKKFPDYVSICTCGGAVDFDKKTTAINITGAGLDNKCYRYFDKQAKNFRLCRIHNITYLKVNEDEYFVVKI